MAISQARSKRKQTGARYTTHRRKSLHELGRLPRLTKLSEKKLRGIRVMGGNQKIILLAADHANVLDKKTNKSQKVKIKTVLENPANRHFVRRNILTRGTIIETELGKAKITSRPGQHGFINAVLI